MAFPTAAVAAERGLSTREARRRLARDGRNVLPTAPPPSPVAELARQMVHFFALLLWVAAGMALLAGMPQLAAAIVIVILVNGGFAFAQEYRAEKAGRRLRDLLPARVAVRRDGVKVVVEATELVRGDIVLLEPGDRISADLELLTAHALAVDESLLTGESVAVRPPPGRTVYAGTFVVEGEAEARVTAVAGATRLAGIAALTQRTERSIGPLARRLRRVVLLIAVIAVTVGTGFGAVSLLLGTTAVQAFLFGVGVTVALVPEGLLPTVTLSLARAAQRMAARGALVRRLSAVQTLGSTTFICTDKTGTLTRNEMSVVEVWTPDGRVRVTGQGYRPEGELRPAAGAGPGAVAAGRRAAHSAVRCSAGRVVRAGERWRPVGDPMEAAVYVLAHRAGVDVAGIAERPPSRRFPFDPRRRRSSVVAEEALHVTGAPDTVLPRCGGSGPAAHAAVEEMTGRGLRVLAVATRPAAGLPAGADPDPVERDLTLLGLLGLEDPPRDDVAGAIAACRRAGIALMMVTGDHPATARAIAAEVGLARPGAPVLTGAELPRDSDELGRLLDHDGVVVARVAPEEKLLIARALRHRGHVVAMTGDGVNDGPALREAHIGIAMGASGTDVAREAADLVLLDDHFATIVTAVELGRATFDNIRRFLTYHLTDNVAELVPFVAWSLTAGNLPLALGVLQILALDIGTDLLPALALGAEPANPRTMLGPARTAELLDGAVLRRVFGVLGPAEAAVEMAAFAAVLLVGGWTFGADPAPGLLAQASGTAFAAVVLGQFATAFACRSQSRPVWRLNRPGNPLLVYAVVVELGLLLVFVGVPAVTDLLGGSFPAPLGWLLALCAVPAVLVADALHKSHRRRGR